MKAFIANAEWSPRKGYSLSEKESKEKRAAIGSQVWKSPVFEIKDIPTPNIENDEILIRIKRCGICGSDTHLYETDKDGYIIFSGPVKLPCIIGHEFSGVVEKTGSRVRTLKKGDMVAVESVMWCGVCQSCRSGFPNQCMNIELIGLSIDGAFAQYIAVNERYCWKINELKEIYSEEDLFDVGAIIEPIGCAYNGIFIAGGGFNPGSTVVVYGAGPIGLGAIALAKTAGASLIIAFDINDNRVNIAKNMGADFAFNINKMDGCKPRDKVLELTKGLGAEIQVEAAGAAPHTIPEIELSLSSQGKIIYLGRAATSTPMHLDILVSEANKVIGARGHAGYGIFPYIIKLLHRGRLNVMPMISRKYPFEKVMEALKMSVERDDAKILIRI